MWHVVAASVLGTSHRQSGTVCQDFHLYYRVGDLLVAAVADGAGSASHADIGASLAASAALPRIGDSKTSLSPVSVSSARSLVLQGFAAARASLEDEARERGIALRDLATTLLVVLATPDSAIAGQVGDGAIVGLTTNDELISISIPARGEYINETNFLGFPMIGANRCRFR